MVLMDESGRILLQKSKFLGVTTNNVAEWSALEGAVKTLVHFAQRQKNIKAVIRSDSDLVVKQFNGKYKIRDSELKCIAARIQTCLAEQPNLNVSVVHVPRRENRLADRIANDALDAVKG
jgi:ribonuclease HI